MTRPEVAIALATINRLNKTVAYWIDLGGNLDQIQSTEELSQVPLWREGILKFLKQQYCHSVVKYIMKMYCNNFLKDFLKEGADKCQPETYTLLNELSFSIDKLKEFAYIYYKMYKAGPFEMFVEELSNDKALELFKRVQKAGYLDVNFQPIPQVTPMQKKAIAWGIGQQVGLRWRIQWITFERQWKCDRLGTVPMPECYSKQYEEIKQLFPEVDFSPLTAIKDQCFNTPTDTSRVDELFLALITHEYIDRTTPIWQFRKIFSIEDEEGHEFKPVNWIKEQRKLTYFLRYAMGEKSKDVWVKAQHCFTINGKTPNKGSLKSGFAALKRDHPDFERFDTCLRGIALHFRRE